MDTSHVASAHSIEQVEEGREGDISSMDRLLGEVPMGYIIDVLRELAPRLIAGINCVTISPSDSTSKQPPKTQACTFDFSRRSTESPLAPDCFLAFTFPPSHSKPTHLLVPGHSIVYALVSRLFELVSLPSSDNSSASQKESTLQLNLPIFGPFALPSYQSFVILHSYLHGRSTAQLLSSLILPTIASTFSRPPSPPPSPILNTSTSRSSSDGNVVEQQLKHLHQLRRTGVILQISDEGFWSTLQRAHDIIHAR